jgi:hypothetical protein
LLSGYVGFLTVCMPYSAVVCDIIESVINNLDCFYCS